MGHQNNFQINIQDNKNYEVSKNLVRQKVYNREIKFRFSYQCHTHSIPQIPKNMEIVINCFFVQIRAYTQISHMMSKCIVIFDRCALWNNSPIPCLRSCAVHIVHKEAHVSYVPAWIAPAWDVSCGFIPLIFNVIVLVDNLGFIMNVYVNFFISVNASDSVIWSGPWVCYRYCRFNPSIRHLLNVGADMISSRWVVEIHNHSWYITALKGLIKIKNDIAPIIAVADGMYRIDKVCVYVVFSCIWYLDSTGHIITGEEYLVFFWCFNSRISFKEASEVVGFHIWTISLVV